MSSEIKSALLNAIESAEIGKEININFSGVPQNIEIELAFKGGWRTYQTILPGQSFRLVKGEEGFLEEVKITFNKYDGIQSV